MNDLVSALPQHRKGTAEKMAPNIWVQSSILFDLAKKNPQIWQRIIGQEISHSVFGKGVVRSIQLEPDLIQPSYFEVRFRLQADSRPDGLTDKRIALIAFEGSLVTEVSVGPDLAKEMDAHRKAKEKSAAAERKELQTHIPVIQRSNALMNSKDHERPKSFLSEREIQSLVHLTTMKNWYGIMKTGAILSRRILDGHELQYECFDAARWDNAVQYVNCSITYYNFFMFYGKLWKAEYNSSVDPPRPPVHEYVQLVIKPDFIWKVGTKVCSENAAAKTASPMEASIGLEGLFAEEVVDTKGRRHTRRDKPNNLPTCIQAEVLVHEGIALKDVQKVLVPNIDDVKRAKTPGWHGPVEANWKAFAYRDEWWPPGNDSLKGGVA